MVDIFKEVDEELRQDRMVALWKKYGGLVIGVAVLIVVVTAANVAWDAYREGARNKRATEFAEGQKAILDERYEDAAAIFTDSGESGSKSYQTLTLFAAADAYRRDGEVDKAADAYLAAAEIKGLDPIYRDLALVRWGWLVAETATYDELSAKLAGMLETVSQWRFLAREILGYAAFKGQDYKIAREHYDVLATDDGTPPGIRQRASDMLQLIESVDKEGKGDNEPKQTTN